MRLYIKQNNDVMGICFTVFDELGVIKYKVAIENKAMGINYKICDSLGEILLSIRQKSFLFFTLYSIDFNDRIVNIFYSTEINRTSIKIIGEQWGFDGDILSKNFLIKDKQDRVVAEQKRVWTSLNEYYQLEINKEEEKLICIAIAICVNSIIVPSGFEPLPTN